MTEDLNPSGKVVLWRCVICGEVYPGVLPPEVCPACGVGADLFEQYEEEVITFNSTKEEKANNLINSFKENFGLEDKDVSFDIHELELEKLESKLYEVVGRKASKLAKEKEENSKRFSLESTDEQNVQSVPYASLFEKL